VPILSCTRKTPNCAADHILLANPAFNYQHRLSCRVGSQSHELHHNDHALGHSSSASRWDQFKVRVSEWRQRARSRRELEGLDDSTWRDIGITRCDVRGEVK